MRERAVMPSKEGKYYENILATKLKLNGEIGGGLYGVWERNLRIFF
jgi:hypothetical protein